MKRMLRVFLLAVVLAAAACAPGERTIVLLSTNDMHANIRNMPRLASAVEACRDTAQYVLLVDAGDRWTGNAFVDRAPMPGMPMVALMNRLGYDVGTLGNHEFDFGQVLLAGIIDRMDFEVVCANVVSDTTTFPQLPPYVIVEEGGVRIGFVGVVTNYEGPGHPAGNADRFEGLTFPDPQQMAAKYAAELRLKVDVLVLLSHMGDGHDADFLATASGYDLVVGGHTHKMIDTLINGSLLTQTGKNLANVGVTTIRMRGKKIESLDFRLVPLSGYAEEPDYKEQVEGYYSDKELNRQVGEFAATANKWGLANWMAEAVRDESDAQIGIYHIGGVRLDSISAGGVIKAQIYSLEPFGTRIARMQMTPAQMRRAILTKYNDKENTKESHRIDLISTTPYVIVLDAMGDAVDVRFPALREGQRYTIGVSDYVYNNYKELVYTDGEPIEEEITDVLFDDLEEHSPLVPDNMPRQQTVGK